MTKKELLAHREINNSFLYVFIIDQPNHLKSIVAAKTIIKGNNCYGSYKALARTKAIGKQDNFRAVGT